MNKNIIIGVLVVVIIVMGVAGSKDSKHDMKMNNDKNMKGMDDGKMMENRPDGVIVGGAVMVPNLDIVDNAVQANNVTTVVAAVQAAGLVETLKSEGPFTVFAPTNAAFDKLPEGTVETLLQPENKDMLAGILTYHVIAGAALNASELQDGDVLTTVNGQKLTVQRTGNQIMINGARIVTADVISSNGTTHVIDTVLTPSS